MAMWWNVSSRVWSCGPWRRTSARTASPAARSNGRAVSRRSSSGVCVGSASTTWTGTVNGVGSTS